MKIGIIGSGNMGKGLGTLWAKKGHQVFFSFSRDAEKLRNIAYGAPNATCGSPADAVKASDVILLSVRWTVVPEAITAAGPLDGKVLIDCTNPLLPDLSGLAIGHTTSAAEEIVKMAPGARVVKAFNTVFAEVYSSPSRLSGSRMSSMFFCGDDPEAKKDVLRLITDVGFQPIDCGGLLSARLLEPLAMLVIHLGYGMGMGTGIGLSLMRR
ncbi:MAG: NAD(P)-binding domain-containing protein [Thermodesulfovibrionales bacterium]